MLVLVTIESTDGSWTLNELLNGKPVRWSSGDGYEGLSRALVQAQVGFGDELWEDIYETVGGGGDRTAHGVTDGRNERDAYDLT